MVQKSVCIKCKYWGVKCCDYAEMTGKTKLSNLRNGVQPKGTKPCAFFETKSGRKRQEKPLPDNEDVKRLFDDGLSNAEIATALGASHKAVLFACQVMELRRKPRMQTNQFTQYEVRDKQSGQVVCVGNFNECAEATGLHRDSIRKIAMGIINGKDYDVKIVALSKRRGKAKVDG